MQNLVVHARSVATSRANATAWAGFIFVIVLTIGAVTRSTVIGQSASVFYVRQGASGSFTGLDWTNAYSSLPPTLVRGATYYIADGSYPSYTFATPTSGTTPITIRKATQVDHGTSSGWLASYGDGAASWRPVIFSTSFWVFDGVTGGGPGSWTSGHGFLFNNVACERAFFVTIANGQSNIAIRHTSFTQTGNTETCVNPSTNVTDGIYAAAGGTSAFHNSIFEYLYFDNLGGLPFFWRSGSGNVIQYSYTGNICGKSVADVNAHCEMLVMYDMSRLQFRFNYVAEAPSSGGLVKNNAVKDALETSDSVYIYGNVFRNGLPVACNSGVCSNWWIFNNTFIDFPSGGPIAGSGTYLDNSKFYNNIAYYGRATSMSSVSYHATHDYNWYSVIPTLQCRMNPAPHENICVGCSSGCDTVTSTINPFVNVGGAEPADLRLLTPIRDYPGVDLCSLVSCAGDNLFNRDAFGRLRGEDSVWDRGAYEQESVRPRSPTNVRIIRQ